MKTGLFGYRDILFACLTGALLLFAQSALGQYSHPIPSGANAAAAAAEADKEEKESKMKDKKDRFTYGKRHETSVTTESSNATIQKTKHGTSDATVSTGAFKESFIDVGLATHYGATPSPTPKAKYNNPLRSTSTSVQSSASPSPSAQPAASASPAPSAPTRLDITTGVSPAPDIAATPKPH
jgi:hypothetical protein